MGGKGKLLGCLSQCFKRKTRAQPRGHAATESIKDAVQAEKVVLSLTSPTRAGPNEAAMAVPTNSKTAAPAAAHGSTVVTHTPPLQSQPATSESVGATKAVAQDSATFLFTKVEVLLDAEKQRAPSAMEDVTSVLGGVAKSLFETLEYVHLVGIVVQVVNTAVDAVAKRKETKENARIFAESLQGLKEKLTMFAGTEHEPKANALLQELVKASAFVHLYDKKHWLVATLAATAYKSVSATKELEREMRSCVQEEGIPDQSHCFPATCCLVCLTNISIEARTNLLDTPEYGYGNGHFLEVVAHNHPITGMPVGRICACCL